MPYLDVKLGTDSLLVRFVGRIDFVVGRLPKADIQLRDMSVSRLHVQFFIDSRGQAFVRDLGSSGGTLVNDTPLSNALARLHDGTRIRVGQGRIVFYDAQPPVNAVDPPGKSEPRGLIRFNARKRVILGGETVLAAEKVAAQTADGGPAEAPPVINSAEFTEDGKAIEDASVRAPGAKP
ncbi:MAG: FHA domain-containing protein, partial [Planctomycetaceae bacterium]|nr:FHA domain-containing protein [Planctomycetaceae bacterium]